MKTATLPVVKIDHDAHRVYVDGKEVSLEPIGYEMLRVFLKHPGKVISREDFLDSIWGDGASLNYEVRLVDTNVSRIRKVIGDSTIATLVGYGYRFDGKVG